MMIHPYVLFPLFGAIISLVTALIAACWFRKSGCASAKNVATIHCLKNIDVRGVWQENGLDQELEALLERRLNGMVEAMKEQIPMVGMLLSQAREDKLKAQAQIEIFKAAPEIKQLVLHHLEIRVKSQPSLKEASSVSAAVPTVSAFPYLLIVIAVAISAALGFAAAFLVTAS